MLPRRIWSQIVGRLLRNLELTWINDFPIPVTKLEDVDSPVEVVEIHYGFGAEIIQFEYLFTYKTEDLKIAVFVVTVCKIKIDDGSSRIGVKFNYAGI